MNYFPGSWKVHELNILWFMNCKSSWTRWFMNPLVHELQSPLSGGFMKFMNSAFLSLEFTKGSNPRTKCCKLISDHSIFFWKYYYGEIPFKLSHGINIGINKYTDKWSSTENNFYFGTSRNFATFWNVLQNLSIFQMLLLCFVKCYKKAIYHMCTAFALRSSQKVIYN